MILHLQLIGVTFPMVSRRIYVSQFRSHSVKVALV